MSYSKDMDYLARFRKFIIPIIFLLCFIPVAYFAARLNLFIDDYTYALDNPSLTRSFGQFFSEYTAFHGIYRPLALLYYLGIYSLYFISPALSHIIPLVVHAAAAYVLYLILTIQLMLPPFALLTGLLFFLHPYATEQYMWLSANPGTVVNLLFFVQILVILIHHDWKKTLAIIGTLSIASALLYESTFFFFIPLIYLMYVQFGRPALRSK